VKLTTADSLSLQRYLDREMSTEQAEAFRRRLAAEPALRAAAAEREAIADGFALARQDVRRAPAGFASAVLAEVRQLPARVQLEAAATAAVVLRVCRRVLIAAAVLAGVALAVQAGLFETGLGEQLQAAPDEVQAEMQRLDELAKGLDAPLVEQRAEPRRR